MSGPPPAGSSGAASGPAKTKHWRQSPHAKANDYRKQPWFQQDASTAVATEILMAKKRGDFILRFAPERVTSPAMKDDFVLSVKGEDKVYHVLLHAEPHEGHQYYHVKPTGHCFQDMFDIIQFGSKFPFHFPGSDGAQLQITLNVAEVPKSKIVTAKQGVPAVSAPRGTGIVRRLSTAFSDKDEMEKWITASQTEEETQLNKVQQKQQDAELKAKKDEADKEAAAAAKAHAEAEARASHENKTAAQQAAAREREEQMRAEREYAEKTERERRALSQKMGKPTHEPNQAHNHPLDQQRDQEQFCTLKRLAGKKGTPLLPDVNSQFNYNA